MKGSALREMRRETEESRKDQLTVYLGGCDAEWTKRHANFHDVYKIIFRRNLDIRDAILQLLKVVRDGNKRVERHEIRGREISEQILERVNEGGSGSTGTSSSGSSLGTDQKIDNISNFLLRSDIHQTGNKKVSIFLLLCRMNAKLDGIERRLRRNRGGDVLQTLAQETFDIVTLLPIFVDNTKDEVTELATKLDVSLLLTLS